MPKEETGLDLDKFFDSLDDDNDSAVDDELNKALEDEADNDADESSDDDQKDDDISVEERLALLEKENKGLKKDIVKVRHDRREAREREARIKELIREVASEKKGSQTDDKTGADAKDSLENLKLAIEYDDDGNPYVPADALAEILKGQEKKISETKEEIAARLEQEEAYRRVQSEIKSVLEKDEAYPKVFSKVEKLVGDLNEKVKQIQIDRDEPGLLTPDQALDLLEQEGVLEEWQKENPGVDPDIIVNAFTSKRSLNRALSVLKKLEVPEDDKGSDRKLGLDQRALDKLNKKPSSPGKGGTKYTESIVERIGKSSAEDLLNLSDKDVERLMARMRQEELESY